MSVGKKKKVQRLSPVLKEWERGGVREKNWKEALLGARRRGLECVVPWKASEENVSRRREEWMPQHFPLDFSKVHFGDCDMSRFLESWGEGQIGRSYRKNRCGESKQVLILTAFCCSVDPMKTDERKLHFDGVSKGALPGTTHHCHSKRASRKRPASPRGGKICSLISSSPSQWETVSSLNSHFLPTAFVSSQLPPFPIATNLPLCLWFCHSLPIPKGSSSTLPE